MSRYLATVLAVLGTCLSVLLLPQWAFGGQVGWVGETSMATSEEHPPAMCWPNQWPRRAICQGAYCDNFGFQCERVRAGATQASWGDEAGFTPWLKSGSRDCGDQGAIAGVACKGSYCDEVSPYCVRVTGVRIVNCHDTGSFSEEGGGSFLIGDNKLIRKMTCTGKHCDNKSFQVCDVVPQ